MNTLNKSNSFQTLLVQQEYSLSRQPYQDHRMQVEARLAQAERYQKHSKVVGFIAILLAAGMFPIVASGAIGSADPFDKNANILSVSLALLYIVACIVGAVSVASFYSRFSPRTRQAREDLRDEMLREMRSDLAALREQITHLQQEQQK